jgi:hypothetical protein
MITKHPDKIAGIVLQGITKLVDTEHKTGRNYNALHWQVTMRVIVIIVNTALIAGLIVWAWRIATSI